MTNYDPDDRADPSEQPIRARVPENVSKGSFSTGVIVMTAQTEFILDFVQNLGRPHQIVSRVVMPHSVLPQLVDALYRNMDLYRKRWGELPQAAVQQVSGSQAPTGNSPGGSSLGAGIPANPQATGPASGNPSPQNPAAPNPFQQNPAPPQAGSGGGADGAPLQSESNVPPNAPHAGDNPLGSHESESRAAPGNPQTPPGARQASAQEIYDDLKIRDELLSGAYANAVMIGHGPHEFSFDFITNFYPHSAVSARVFLAAGQVPRLYDSLKGTWEQLRQRLQPPGDGNPPTA